VFACFEPGFVKKGIMSRSFVRKAVVAAVAGFLVSCSSDLEVYRYDNPSIRGRQQAQLDAALPPGPGRERVKRFIGPRVGFLVSGDPRQGFDPLRSSVGTGRAACVTEDGYYLTACHVVDGDPFFLVEPSGWQKPFALDKRSWRSEPQVYPGRIVWRDPAADLALVKFERCCPRFFGSVVAEAGPGVVVHTADDVGRGLVHVSASAAGTGSLVGNGAFQAAGTVISSGRRWRGTEARVMSTDMVARGGMSGSPLVTGNDELAGIIVQVEVNPFLPGRARTIAVMMPPARLHEIIGHDRKSPRAR
jgi:S1-C subfamily serine protease